MKFGKVISSFRLSRGMEQKALAEASKISVNYLSLIENDKRNPSMSVLNSLAGSFGVPVSVLLYEAAKNSGASPKKADKETFEAAQPIIEMLLTYLADGKETTRLLPKEVRTKKHIA